MGAMMIMDEEEVGEAFAECMRIRERMRVCYKVEADDELRHAILAVGKAAKALCAQVEATGQLHEPTYETVVTRAEILGSGL